MTQPVLLVLLLAAYTQAKEVKESCEAQVKQLKELTAKLQAAEEQNKVLTKQIAASGEVSYVSAQAIVDSLGYVTDAALGKESLNVDLTPVHTAADASYAAFQAAGQQATVAASKGYAASTEAYGSASKIAQDLYGQHVSQHTGEYYDAAMDAYTSHMASHVGTVRKAYNDNLHSHVNTATEKLFAGYGAALEGSKTISPKVWDVVTMVKQSVTSAEVGKQFSFLMQPQTFTVPGLGKKMTLNHGYMDAALMLVQALVAAYVGALVAAIFIWRLFLKSVVWNIGIKLLGREVCLRLSVNVINVSLKLARFFVSLALSLVLTVFSWALFWFILGACGVTGVVLLHAFETGLKVGLKPGMRLALGLCFGLLFGFIFQCTFCRKRKAKASATNTKNSTPKTASKKEADAKSAPKPTKKK